MRFKILIILFFASLGNAFGQGNSIYQINMTAVCWTTPASVDSNLYAYWLLSSRETEPRVVSYLDAAGQAVVVAGGNLQNGFCCCSGTQDTLGITINNDTLILVQNGETYTYIGGGGADDDWRWVDPGAQENMYEAVYRMGKASIFTQDTTYGFQADSTFRFRTDNGTAIFEWVRGNLKVPEKTWLFRAPGGGTGQSQNDANSITIARTNPTTTRTTIGKLRFAAPFGVGDSLRVAAMIDAIDEEGGGDTSNASLNFYTRQLGESFVRNTMTIEGDGRLELDRYNLFSDGVPANILGYDVTDKDVKRHPITGTPQANYILGLNSLNTGVEWKDPLTIGSTNLTFSGASSPVTLLSSTGTDVTFTAGTGISLSQAGNNLTITNSASAVNIYNTNGSLTNSRTLTAGAGLNLTYDLSSTSTHILRKATGVTGVVTDLLRLQYTGTDNFDGGAIDFNFDYGGGNLSTGKIKSIVPSAGATWMDFVVQNGFPTPTERRAMRLISSGPSGTVEISSAYTLPNVDGSAGQAIVTNGLGVADWQTISSGATNLTFTGAASPVTLNSSSGTDVTLTAGTGISFSQTGNNLTITSTVSPVDSSIYKLLPLGDVTVLSNENTLTFNTGHENGDAHSTMRFQTDYNSDDFQGRLINMVNTASIDSSYWYWYDGSLFFKNTSELTTISDVALTYQSNGRILHSSDLTGQARLDSVLTVRRSSGGPGAIRFEENPINGNNYYEWTAPASLTSNVSTKYPSNNATGVLFNDGSGNTSWATYSNTIGGLFAGTTDVNGAISVTLSGTPSIGACTCTNASTLGASFRYIFSATFTGGTGVTVHVYDADTASMLSSSPVNFSLICR